MSKQGASNGRFSLAGALDASVGSVRAHIAPENGQRLRTESPSRPRALAMGNEIFIFGIIALAGILAFCAVGIVQEELTRRRVRAQLRAPLLHDDDTESGNAIERRVELAVREARLGYRRCLQCEFTNPRRAVACVICGGRVEDKRKNQTRSKTLTWRQQRVRRRKEWVRKVAEAGEVVWHHNAESVGRDLVQDFPAYVLRSKRARASEESSLEQTTALASQLEVNSNEDGLPVRPIVIVIPVETASQVAAALERELSELAVSAVPVSQAEPMQVAFSALSTRSAASITQEMKDTIANAMVDFPTKLAQFITSSSAIFLNATHEQETNTRNISRFKVNRKSVLADSIDAIATMTPTQARAAIRVDFSEEQGIDAGGVYREWFLLVNEKIVAPEAGIFTCVDPMDQAFYLNAQSRHILGEHHLAHFLVAGRLLGRALLEGNVTGFHLALPLLKIILGLPVSVGDLAYFDPEAFKNLKWMLENDGVEALGLDFTYVERLPSGAPRVVELIPNGSNISVTDANKRFYVDRKLQYLLFESVSSQLFAFLKGLYEVVPVELLMLFDAEELDYVLSGSDEIDVDDWERNTVTSKSLADHPALANFWTSVRALSTEDRRRMLQFATGATRVPPGGFSALTSYDGRLCRFTLKGVDPQRTRGYIRSHACFNRLDLPLHLDQKEMRFAIAAVLSSRSFGFTTA